MNTDTRTCLSADKNVKLWSDLCTLSSVFKLEMNPLNTCYECFVFDVSREPLSTLVDGVFLIPVQPCVFGDDRETGETTRDLMSNLNVSLSRPC